LPCNYVGKNPIIRIDPDGQFWDIVIDVALIVYDVAEAAYEYTTEGRQCNYESCACCNVIDAAAPFLTGCVLGFRAEKESIGISCNTVSRTIRGFPNDADERVMLHRIYFISIMIKYNNYYSISFH